MATSIQTCYRHGDRRAGVICQRCDRPICPDCMRQAAVGFHCPECTRAGAAKVYSGPQAFRRDRPIVTVVLVALVGAAFVLDLFWTVNVGPGGPIGVLSLEGQLYGPNVWAGDWWRPFTVGFVHANLMHVGFNALLLYLLGQMLEPALGRVRFLILYTMSLLGGSALILLLNPDQRTVGASGAVFGLMGAAFIGMRSRGIDPFSTGIGPLLVINLVLTFLVPGISIAGHLGGLAAGAAGGWLLFDLAPRLERGGFVTGAVCIAATIGFYILCLELPGPGPLLPSAF